MTGRGARRIDLQILTALKLLLVNAILLYFPMYRLFGVSSINRIALHHNGADDARVNADRNPQPFDHITADIRLNLLRQSCRRVPGEVNRSPGADDFRGQRARVQSLRFRYFGFFVDEVGEGVLILFLLVNGNEQVVLDQIHGRANSHGASDSQTFTTRIDVVSAEVRARYPPNPDYLWC